MVHKGHIRTVIGIIGNIISFGLFLSPVPTFYNIWKAKSVQAFKPDPYVVTLLNCAMWVFYGLPFVKPDSILLSTINGIGFVIEIFYVLIFILYSNWAKRKKIFLLLILEAIVFIALVLGSLLGLHGKKRSTPVGIMCLIFNIAMYFSPLTVMSRVIRTKSVKYMPFYLSLTNFANGLVWFVYAFLHFDAFVVIPNGLGALSGLIQLVLYGYYYRTTNWDEEDDDEKKHEVQLSDNIART